MITGSLDQLKTSSLHPSVKVVSTDVFDTLLLRDTTPEPARFQEISRRQVEALRKLSAPRLSAFEFYLLRRDAARTVYATKTPRHGGREARWREIFHLIFSQLGLTAEDSWLQLCADVELAFEQSRLSLNRPLLGLLEAARDAGKEVVCMSDMYLSSTDILSLIDAVAGRELGFAVYSSADHGYGKGCGALYRRLAEDLTVDYAEIVHCGDSWHADYNVPAGLGIRAHFLPRAMPWRMVRKLRSYWFDRALPAL